MRIANLYHGIEERGFLCFKYILLQQYVRLLIQLVYNNHIFLEFSILGTPVNYNCTPDNYSGTPYNDSVRHLMYFLLTNY